MNVQHSPLFVSSCFSSCINTPLPWLRLSVPRRKFSGLMHLPYMYMNMWSSGRRVPGIIESSLAHVSLPVGFGLFIGYLVKQNYVEAREG